MTYTPHELYEIQVYNHAGELQFLLQKWSRLEYHKRLDAAWNHQITLEFGSDDPDLIPVRGIQRDWIVVIYRVDQVTSVRTKVYEGFHTTIVDQIRANGGIIINLYGVGYTQLLHRRIVLPDVGEEYSIKTGNAEPVLKSFVSDSMISPVTAARIFPGITLAANLGTGEPITYSARYVILQSLCETVAEQGNLNFGIIGGTNVGEFVFDARPLWGDDRTEENTEGNQPVIFSIERDNMLIPILSLNSSAEQNYAYVGGEGQGADRVIQEVQDAVAIAISPWGRKEVFVEARQQADTTALIATGELELENRKAIESLSFNIKQTDASRWLREYFLGDLITAKYFTYSFDKQISEISVTVTSGRSAQTTEIISIEMSDVKI